MIENINEAINLKFLNSPYIFGVRHLSPSSAYHLIEFLDEIKPDLLLIEGISDANAQIENISNPKSKPPIAILAYTEEIPIKTILYPFAEYSPEYQAILWAKKKKIPSRFIDLPSNIMLAIEYRNRETEIEEIINKNKEINQRKDEEKFNNNDEELFSIYDKITEISNETDFDTFWERNFEKIIDKNDYRMAVIEYGRNIRELSNDVQIEIGINIIREGYMRYNINKAIDEGFRPEKIVVITGAYHSTALSINIPHLTEEEINKLPSINTKLTLMPYSYYKLSSQSGYGAGNKAPFYYELMWKSFKEKNIDRLPIEYLSKVASYLRESGTFRSTAEVIESVNLAKSLSYIQNGSNPVLKDLRDAAITLLGQGYLSSIAESILKVDIGTNIGNLPEGISRTSIQDDFYRELKKLKLEKYKDSVANTLTLDLRENRNVKSQELAYLDLYRSVFLHRLKILNIRFAQQQLTNQKTSTYKEVWVCQWTPESEIEIVEAALKGETIETAACFELKNYLLSCEMISEVSNIIRLCCEANLFDILDEALSVLQKLSVDSTGFLDIARACYEIASVISFGDIRRFDTNNLIPILEKLFLHATLLLINSSNCDNSSSNEIIQSIHLMNVIANEHYKIVDYEFWNKKMQELTKSYDINSKIAGYCCSILLEKNLIKSEELNLEISRRLSLGTDALSGALWFEGLSMKNKYSLLSRLNLWEQLSSYVSSLDGEQFKKALVFLRRAFSNFESNDKIKIVDNLGEILKLKKEDVMDHFSQELTTEEKKKIDELNQFDFGDM